MKKYIYTEEQITQMYSLLNRITVTGISDAKNIVVISQLIEAGAVEEEKGVEGD